MKLKPLSLKDRGLFLDFLSLKRHSLAAYSFENIFIWKSLYSVRWAVIEKSLCVFFQDKSGCFLYLPPLSRKGDRRAVDESFRIMDGFNSNKELSRIENIEDEGLHFFSSLGLVCREKPGDYIYLRKELSGLKGYPFKSKRSCINYFSGHYDAEVLALSPGDSSSCLRLYKEWMRERSGNNRDDLYCGMLSDSLKCLRLLLKNYPPLKIRGLAVRVGGKLKGFTLGYELNDETFCVLYEVTDLSVKGLAQFIFREFCASLTGYKYINSMDDSCLESLKRVKMSYHPYKLAGAFIATRKYA